MYTATYSPDDNKLRLYAATRLDADTYARVKAAGFRWAPKQDLFVAPAWSPGREDLLLELAGEIDDDDTSLTERAEERAERFTDYHESRLSDAHAAHAAVSAIADNIPFGQPILVGHHSERHARKDAERIESGMRKAVKMWKTAEYWTGRAEGAIRHAKHKERPDVRARRIKGLEAEVRKVERSKADAEKAIRLWGTVHEDDGSIHRKDGAPSTFLERVTFLAGHTNTAPFGIYSDLTSDPPKITPDEAWARTLAAARSSLAHCARWIEHLTFRLTYERAMLAASGGTLADQTGPEKGGACKCWASPGRYDGGWSYIQKVNRVSVTVLDNWGNGGKNFTRTMPFDKLTAIMPALDVQRARDEGRLIETEDGRGFVLL